MSILDSSTSSDQEWLGWVAEQKQILRLMMAGALSEAAAKIDAFLALGPSTDLRCDALVLRASVVESQGLMDIARSNLHEARGLALPVSYRKYTIELALAGFHEKEGAHEAAISWYLAALETVVEDPTTSGGVAVANLLDLRDYSSLSSWQRDLCLRAVHQAWELFQLLGAPDVSDLRGAAQILIEASTRPLPSSAHT